MTDVTVLVDRHQAFEGEFDSGDLAIPPRLSTVILTCVDARVDPAHLFSLGLGEALVMRNAGGSVTTGVVKDLVILGVLSSNWPGSRELELVVIRHTGCGMVRLATLDTQEQVAKRLGLTNDEVAAMAVTDPTAAVQSDIELLRNTSAISDRLVASGFVYDVNDGSLTEVVSPSPLRSPS